MRIKLIVRDQKARTEYDGRLSFRKSLFRMFPSLYYPLGELERWEKWMGCDSRVIEERKIKFYWDSLNQITNYV